MSYWERLTRKRTPQEGALLITVYLKQQMKASFKIKEQNPHLQTQMN